MLGSIFAAKNINSNYNMNIERLKSQIKKIAEKKPCGFTYSPKNNTFPQKGYVVAIQRTQDCIGNRGLFHVIKYYIRNQDYYIGGWRNEDGIMQFDASMVYYNIEEAVLAAIANKQRAIFSLSTGKEIMACDFGNYIKYVDKAS